MSDWKTVACAVSAACLAGPGNAQGSRTDTLQIYGSIDAAATWVDNAGGTALRRLDSGSLYANRLGWRGSEDLGGGLAAVVTLESGFNVDDGTSTLGRFFGRQSFVGLGSRDWGTLTFGRQYDFLYAGSPLPLDVGALLIGGLAGASGGAGTSVDNHSGGVRYDNAAKWTGRFGAWTLGAMGGLGSENGADRMTSAVVSYRDGPVWVGVGGVHDNFGAAASGNRVVLGSLNWDVTPGQELVVTVSSAKAAVPADTRSRNRVVQVGWLTRVTAPLLVGAMAASARSRDAKLVDGRLTQVGVGAQYALSKRTWLYGIWSGVNTSGSEGTAYSGIPGIGAPADALRSTDGQQNVVKLGVLHRF